MGVFEEEFEEEIVDVVEVAIVGIGCRLPGKVHGPDERSGGLSALAARLGDQLAVG